MGVFRSLLFPLERIFIIKRLKKKTTTKNILGNKSTEISASAIVSRVVIAFRFLFVTNDGKLPVFLPFTFINDVINLRLKMNRKCERI